jgi:Putative Actinobacterial Holin-X, holin superfamily III
MEQERHLAQSLAELRDDLKGFIETRYEIFRSELNTGIKKARGAAVLFGAAVVLAMVGVLLLGFCVALAIGLAFGAFTNQVGLVWGFLIAGVAGVGSAVIAAMAGKARLKAENLAPKRTLRVLQRDQAFLKGGQFYGESRTRRQA